MSRKEFCEKDVSYEKAMTVEIQSHSWNLLDHGWVVSSGMIHIRVLDPHTIDDYSLYIVHYKFSSLHTLLQN